MSLRVIEPGLCTLVVDFGRPGHRSLGVAVGGAADRVSLALGNALVGNLPDAAALEISLAGPTLRADCDLACVLFGAPFDCTTNRRLTVGTTFTLQQGDELAIHGARRGMRAYLCVRGGILTEPILGSRSGLAAIKADAVLPCNASTLRPRRLSAYDEFEHLQFERPQPWNVRVLPGTQADWFEPGALYSREFTISSSSNRMGLRLQGTSLSVPNRELVSEPVSPGAVQVTRDGQCIILGVDGQTIGGYPKIAHVISADQDLLGQLRPGDRIRFRAVDMAEAERAYATKQRKLASWLVRLLA